MLGSFNLFWLIIIWFPPLLSFIFLLIYTFFSHLIAQVNSILMLHFRFDRMSTQSVVTTWTSLTEKCCSRFSFIHLPFAHLIFWLNQRDVQPFSCSSLQCRFWLIRFFLPLLALVFVILIKFLFTYIITIFDSGISLCNGSGTLIVRRAVVHALVTMGATGADDQRLTKAYHGGDWLLHHSI